MNYMKYLKLFVKYGPLLLLALLADLISFVANQISVLYRLIGSTIESYYQKAVKWCDNE